LEVIAGSLVLDSSNSDRISSVDWSTVITAVKGGYITLAGNPNLIRLAIKTGDSAILTSLAENINDLTEVVAVQLLFRSVTVSSTATNITDENAEADNITQSQAGYKEFLHLIKSILSRKLSFSSVLLSESLRQFPCKFGLILLQAFALIFQSFQNDNTRTALLGHEELNTRMHRVSEWTEAILDANFTSFTISSKFHQEIMQAIRAISQAVECSAKLACELETGVGYLSHVISMSETVGKDYKPVPLGLYSLETITF